MNRAKAIFQYCYGPTRDVKTWKLKEGEQLCTQALETYRRMAKGEGGEVSVWYDPVADELSLWYRRMEDEWVFEELGFYSPQYSLIPPSYRRIYIGEFE